MLVPSLSVKLPYAAGESFVVVQGYNSPPTHVGKDAYALDFSQDACDAYGKNVVASSAGTVTLAAQDGYNGGYGTEVLVDDGSSVISRYAHMIPDSIAVTDGAQIRQGEVLGRIGDTGLVMGAACAEHPGTHLHFAMYDEQPDGTFSPHDPEPISGYTNMSAGQWYASDNSENAENNNSEDDEPAVSTDIEPADIEPQVQVQTPQSSTPTESDPIPTVSGSVSVSVSSPAVQTPESNTTATTTSSGGVAETGDVAATSTEAAATATTTTTSTTPIVIAPPDITFNSSTLAVDVTWQAPSSTSSGTITYELFELSDGTTTTGTPIGETTSTTFSYPVGQFNASDTIGIEAVDGNGATSTIATATVSIPPWQFTFQSDDSQASKPSWYQDNWYDLGTGFYGLLRSLTFEGYVSDANYFASHLSLEEFLDPAYTLLNNSYVVSDNAPFTATDTKVTIGGLNIPLRPDKYYRLATINDWQNRSVILMGTVATGTAMWNDFVYGTGRVETDYPFYPYLSAIMEPDYPPLLPPNSPVNIQTSFDGFTQTLTASWPAATDPDGSSTLVTYEFNDSTSTSLDDTLWRSVGTSRSVSIPVAQGNAYLLGVRTVGYSGATSTPNIQSWEFPPGFSPYLVGSWTPSLSQNFILSANAGTLGSVDVYVNDFETTSRFASSNNCSLELFDLASGTPALLADPDNGYSGDQCVGDLKFTFASSSPALAIDHPYQWVFTASTGNPSTQALVRFYGTQSNTAVGSSSDSAFTNAKFTLTDASGKTMFGN